MAFRLELYWARKKKIIFSFTSIPYFLFFLFFSFLFWSFSLSFLLHDHSTNIAMLSMYHQGPMFIALYDLRYASDLPRPTLNRPPPERTSSALARPLLRPIPPLVLARYPPSHPRIDTSLLKGSALSFLLRIWPFSFSSPSSNLFFFCISTSLQLYAHLSLHFPSSLFFCSLFHFYFPISLWLVRACVFPHQFTVHFPILQVLNVDRFFYLYREKRALIRSRTRSRL